MQSRNAGYTLAEILVVMVLLGVIGGTLTRLQISQSRFVSQQDAAREARAASRSGLNALGSRLRMVEVSGGMVSAAPRDLTMRVPYAFGMICGNIGAVTTVSLLPIDSVTVAAATLSGWAWRNGGGSYTYQEFGVTMNPDAGAACAAESISTLNGGQTLALTPQVIVPAGTPIFLFQRERYQFTSSAVLPGRTGLWLTVGSATPEELAAPFDSTARFRFYVLDADTAQDAPPTPVTDIRGLALVLSGSSELIPQGSSSTKTHELSAAVFFKNRTN